MRAFNDSAPPQYAVEIDALAKTYVGSSKMPPKRALKNISLNIPQGSFFALLGPNGAGKSTLINILAGLVVKTSGTARIWGYDIENDMRAARRSIGVVPQELNIDPFFTPREMLELQAGMYGVPRSERRTDEILKAIGLEDKAGAYARTLSGGMRRRLLVGKAMVHAPRVLVLDEPTAGVDIQLRRQLWDYVKELNARGTTILLTTHYLEEAEELCDRVAIINHGRLIACDTTKSLLGGIDSKALTFTLSAPLDAVPDTLSAFEATLSEPNTLSIQFPPSQTSASEVVAAVQSAGLVFTDLTSEEVELEDIFLKLTRASENDEDDETQSKCETTRRRAP
ncbi:ABC transporter ATP-binding protein [Varunaivibrio sulfuroxidans]|uniref:ABC-2 type transport system ATP-binding protein n=1 Tax=Varunaivibrio sulfuroxidans TaxID=1773489 RepID=A0A4R3JDA7_9PROT|nr:ABC transporter ATP-binding protein [Varunaivibrio sulfuroxidans]TCS63677.1 ABC-2 type transport system ATP-binding protein [Varunaivibrio sulfuroxidans]WES30188.1 ABC transporter ATP-binding protein [Varunaivibrio sulfuroxidans]